MKENIRLRFRQSPRGAWCYYNGSYHTSTRKGYELAMADAHKWGFVLPSRMAEQWGVTPRQARRLSHIRGGLAGIDFVDVRFYDGVHGAVISKRMWLLYPDMIPKDSETAYKRCPADVTFEGSAREFLRKAASDLDRLQPSP